MNFIQLLDRPIAFQRAFVTVTGSINAALLLSQIVYWSQRTSDPDGWFYKTQADWRDETGLTRRELDTARKALRELGLIAEELRGLPAVVHFQLQEKALRKKCLEAVPEVVEDRNRGRKRTNLLAESANHRLAESANVMSSKRPTITETTTETTQRLRNGRSRGGGGEESDSDEENGALRRVFDHYLQEMDKSPKLYTLTPSRRQHGMARLRDCIRKADGDMPTAEKLMCAAVDALKASEWHMGKNDKGRSFTDWTDHLFKSTDRLEKWLEQ